MNLCTQAKVGARVWQLLDQVFLVFLGRAVVGEEKRS